MKKFKFSVVMPIYNIESFLNEAINSVINQSIGFKDNIELILVNDGSTDNSETICKKYQEQYQNNIKYIKQENKGVSNARNNGIKLTKGEYINYFDGDDVWDNEVFEKVYNYFQKNKNIDVISCRQKYFENKTKTHSLDYKYKEGSQIIDINKNPDYIQMSVASTFIKSNIAKKYTFDESLKYAEDAKYITNIILEKEKYFVASDCIYNIRKRNDQTSSTQNKSSSLDAYTSTVKYYYNYLIEYSKEKYNKIIPYIQYALINAIKYRVGEAIPDNIPDKIKTEYKNNLIKMLKQIDDEVILNTNKVVIDTKLYLLKLKYNKLNKKDLTMTNNIIYFKNKEVGTVTGNNNLNITNINLNKNNISFSGIVKMPIYFNFDHIYIDALGKTYSCNLHNNSNKNRKSFINEDMNTVKEFNINIELDKKITKLIFYTKINSSEIIFKPNIYVNEKKVNLHDKYLKIKNKMLNTSKKRIFIRNYNILKIIKKRFRRK